VKLNNKVALVTDAAQGLGKAIALAMAKEGANVVICDIKEDTLHGVGKEIETLGKQSLAVRCDVSSSESTSSDRSSVRTAAS